MTNKLDNYRKVGFPGVRKNAYLISENGDVYSIISDKHLKSSVDKDGYFRVSLLNKTMSIHRLVAFHYVPNPNNHPVVDHIDGNKQNNHYTNLEWVTVQENTLRAERMGLRKIRGEDNGNNVYSEELVREICSLYEKGMTVKDVFRHYHGDFTRVGSEHAFYMFLYRLKGKMLWPDVVKEYTYSLDTGSDGRHYAIPNEDSVFTEDQIHSICSMLENKKTIRDILEHFTGSRDYDEYRSEYDVINSIRRRKNWHYITKDYNYTLESTSEKPPIESSEFYKLASDGYTVKEMMKLYGFRRVKDNPKLAGRMKRAYDKYHFIRNLSDKETIQIITN